MVSIAKRFATGKKGLHVSDGLCAGLASPMAHLRRDWPRKCHICAGGVAAPPPHLRRDCASSGLPRNFRRASAGLCTCPRHESLPSQYEPPAPTRLVHHTVADLHRCHDCTATVLRFDWDGRPTILIGLSLRASRAQYRLVVALLQFATGHQRRNIANLAFLLPRSTYSTFYQDAIVAESFHLP